MKPVAWISESEFAHADTGGEHMLVKVRRAENYTIPLYTAPRELSDEEYADACLSYRHDFGLMTKEEQKSLMFQAKEWHRALKKASEK